MDIPSAFKQPVFGAKYFVRVVKTPSSVLAPAVAAAKESNLFVMSVTRPICLILVGLVILSLMAPYLSARAAGRRAKELRSAKADVEQNIETE
ncbi:MAG: hypothetical protein JRH18_18010 [Deltaproteobacteria bacterium]|nr:hypothetical protein [Deltaproteobacteria bacterium]MBW2153553.1 hypothetical protein [Deltaproteobacteria bacterium]